MRRNTLLAGAAGLFGALAIVSAADALPLAKSTANTPESNVQLAGRGGGHHGHGGGGWGHHGGGGGWGHHGGGGWGGGPRFYGPRFRGGFYPGWGYYGGYGYGNSYYYGDDYAGDDCRWLRRRAQATGSRYWWNRYRACIDD
jgi:hypothetical protein